MTRDVESTCGESDYKYEYLIYYRVLFEYFLSWNFGLRHYDNRKQRLFLTTADH